MRPNQVHCGAAYFGCSILYKSGDSSLRAQNSGLPDTPPAVLQCNRASSHRLQCDFIVMGGYGHSRMREFVLGGVTRSILRTMTAPVLMSHSAPLFFRLERRAPGHRSPVMPHVSVIAGRFVPKKLRTALGACNSLPIYQRAKRGKFTERDKGVSLR